LLASAPKPIARHLVISAQDITPTPDSSLIAASDSARTYQNPPRQSYPKELLKHRFVPYGSLTRNDTGVTEEDVEIEVEMDAEKDVMEDGTIPEKKSKKSKGKKRKMEEDAPKKSKKAKTIT